MGVDAMERLRSTESSSAITVEDEERSIDVTAMLRTLYRGRRTLGLITGVALALSIVIAFVLPLRYTSEVSFIPPSSGGGSSVAAALAGQLSAMGAGDLLGGGKAPGELYAGILKSRSVLGAVVQRFDLARLYKVKYESQAETVLMNSTTVVADPKSTIVTVSVTQKTPALAHDIANAYMDVLRNTEGRLALSQSSQRRLFFEQQLVKEKDALADAEVALKETEEHSGLIAPVGQTEAGIRTIAETQAQIAGRQVQLAAVLQSATEQNPDVVRLRSEITDLQGQLARLENGKDRGTTGSIPASRVPAIQLEYVRRERDVKYHEALFELLSKQYEAARLDEARDAPVLQVLDPPSFPDMKSGPTRKYIVAGGLVLGLLLGAMWVLCRDLWVGLAKSIVSGE